MLTWFYCLGCMRAWPENVPEGMHEKRWLRWWDVKCRWHCVNNHGEYQPAHQTPTRIRPALEAAYTLGGFDATESVIRGWHAQVFGDA